MRGRTAASLIILSITALLGAPACTSTGGAGGQGGQALGPAPAFDLESLTGQRVTNETLKGKPTLLTFGASW